MFGYRKGVRKASRKLLSSRKRHTPNPPLEVHRRKTQNIGTEGRKEDRKTPLGRQEPRRIEHRRKVGFVFSSTGGTPPEDCVETGWKKLEPCARTLQDPLQETYPSEEGKKEPQNHLRTPSRAHLEEKSAKKPLSYIPLEEGRKEPQNHPPNTSGTQPRGTQETPTRRNARTPTGRNARKGTGSLQEASRKPLGSLQEGFSSRMIGQTNFRTHY